MLEPFATVPAKHVPHLVSNQAIGSGVWSRRRMNSVLIDHSDWDNVDDWMKKENYDANVGGNTWLFPDMA